ncbi:MAG: acyl-CoA dehydrogenase family protein [Armatimonadota bacterium]|nr:acyl-CoA dehydrogenase family protein [Armatimonadota bacterium]MDR7401659.1 acyl-CoA dehydrogenase family protein [Armatimonadota bacterium]MDR7403585.1 acyl-CoA dehydrogenase family protein [Armatimonadota bacterium]MDR7437787.1 acyl-CoA dehydrogenase family protein [Armatimonadota bacterium]MDR7471289.1 acyl-CoA dehydrogenase family protein [Armatimonadota bacterium]
MSTRDVSAPVAGGSFLIADTPADQVFTPEDFTDEQRLIAQTAREFTEREIAPHLDRLENKDWDLTRQLLRKLGDLGFLGMAVPAAYGGAEMDMISSLVAAEGLAAGSFGVSYGAHVGIGMEPIVFFGTEEQRRRYLPPMVRGELIGAYALTEPTAGSDAMAIRTRAVLSPDGRHYLLSGTKQFITNAAFADIFNIFAKVDGEKHTCFIVERATPGLTVGDEEHKMGIRGSSTASLFLDNAQVPVHNVLGEVGQGFKIAMNILNMGRFRLAAGCVGAAKQVVRLAVGYARERQQFGRPLVEFGLIQHKLAEMAVRLYAAESMAYRTGGLVEAALAGVHGDPTSAMRALEEYAVECAINKVFASEMLDHVADETVQVYGGYGYIEDYPAARAYRDSRINRLFEGTNEINRLLIAGMLLRRAQRGRLDLIPAALRVAQELTAPPTEEIPGGPLADERRAVAGSKKATLFVAGAAVQKHLEAIEEQQEILAGIADMVIETFAMESALLRALRAAQRDGARADLARDLARTYINDALMRVEATAKVVLAAVSEGDTLRTQLAGLRRLLRYTPVDTVALRRQVARRLVAQGGYGL